MNLRWFGDGCPASPSAISFLKCWISSKLSRYRTVLEGDDGSGWSMVTSPCEGIFAITSAMRLMAAWIKVTADVQPIGTTRSAGRNIVWAEPPSASPLTFWAKLNMGAHSSGILKRLKALWRSLRVQDQVGVLLRHECRELANVGQLVLGAGQQPHSIIGRAENRSEALRLNGFFRPRASA